MPLQYARRLTGRSRTPDANRHLGCVLAACAGAVNAVGFELVGHYTSHMTGMVSTFGEALSANQGWATVAAALAIAAFVCGATCCTLMIRHARRRRLHATFAWPLLIESALVLGAGMLGSPGAAAGSLQAWTTICTLTFAMGLQNALITKISRGEIRTTHVTGIVTDLGIEIGRSLDWRRGVSSTPGRASLLAALLVAFTVGCVAGTVGAQHVGRLALVPVAVAIGIAALVPTFDDLVRRAAASRAASQRGAKPGDRAAG